MSAQSEHEAITRFARWVKHNVGFVAVFSAALLFVLGFYLWNQLVA